MRVSIEAIEDMQKIRAKINSADLSDIEFTKGGKVVDIDPAWVRLHKFTGLNNIDFITSGAYEEQPLAIEDRRPINQCICCSLNFKGQHNSECPRSSQATETEKISHN